MTDNQHTAFVSGSGRNIGREIALALARQGANVIINGSSDIAACEAVAQQASAFGVETLALCGDVASQSDVAEMSARALDRFGRVDILVNNAAIRPHAPFLQMDPAQWQRVLDVNMNSAFFLSQAFLPAMQSNSWGRIINITGMNAIHGYNGRAHVSAAKHGLWGLTKSLAKEFGPSGITANAISPGPIGTEHPDNPEMTAHIESQKSRIPMGRLGKPEEIAALCAFLASDGGAFVSGQMIACNGATET